MKNHEELINEYCIERGYDRNKIYVGSDSKSSCKKSFKANYPKGNCDSNIKFVIQFFDCINRYLIWKKYEHRGGTSVFTISRGKVTDALNKNLDFAYKGVEYEVWKQTKVYICKEEEIYAKLDNLIEELKKGN